MKHVGKMTDNGARIVILYRTVPGEPEYALVVGTQQLSDAYHDALMATVESESGQQANELADILAVRRFPDGSVMLNSLHAKGYIRKVRTDRVTVVVTPRNHIALNVLNEEIAKQRGCSVADLAVKGDDSQEVETVKEQAVSEYAEPSSEKPSTKFELSSDELRARADALEKEAAKLRAQAEQQDTTTQTPDVE